MSGSTDAALIITEKGPPVNIRVRFWGTRGSIPTPGSKTQRYGGNTSCVEVNADGSLFIFDAGTGLRELGTELLSRNSGPLEAHLFCSHTHWDHIQGFPFFVPAYRPTTKLFVYEYARDENRIIQALLEQMRPGYFPVTPEALKGRILPKYFENGHAQVGNVNVHHWEQSHPGRSFAFRLSHRERSIVYATDSELDLLLENPTLALEQPEAVRLLPRHIEDFMRDADLLIADTQYTDEEYAKRIGWGHSRVNTVVDLAVRASVHRLALFHHDPLHTDAHLDSIVDAAQKRAQGRGSPLKVFAACEGAELDVS